MRITTKIGSLSVALGLLACSAAAMAQQDNTVRLGMYAIFYHTSAQDVQGPFVPPGVTAYAKDTQTPYFAYLRRLNAHWELELAAGWPPKTDTVARGPATLGSVPWNGQTVGTVKWFAPTFLAEYKFCDESSAWRPYLGAGMNYTHFYDRTINGAGNAALGGPTSVALTDSFGPAATLGVYYHVRGSWSVIASFSVSQVKSSLTANTEGIYRRSTVNFNPSALVVAAGYSF